MTEQTKVDEILREARELSERRLQDALEMVVGTETLEAAVTTTQRQFAADGEEVQPAVLRRALSRWVTETAENMLRDVEWWTGPYSHVDGRFFDLVRKER